jgi:proteasome lid subunit RPN8/RPN11
LAAKHPIKIARWTWGRLVRELSRRGRGQRESGAFLVGRRGDTTRKIDHFICYDDLDPGALQHGIVTLHAAGMSALWDRCRAQSLEVLADVHTHPDRDTRQSGTDRQYPMVPVAGHVAMILPHFGDTSVWSMSGVGIHVFEGGGRWTSYRGGVADAPIKLTAW